MRALSLRKEMWIFIFRRNSEIRVLS